MLTKNHYQIMLTKYHHQKMLTKNHYQKMLTKYHYYKDEYCGSMLTKNHYYLLLLAHGAVVHVDALDDHLCDAREQLGNGACNNRVRRWAREWGWKQNESESKGTFKKRYRSLDLEKKKNKHGQQTHTIRWLYEQLTISQMQNAIHDWGMHCGNTNKGEAD